MNNFLYIIPEIFLALSSMILLLFGKILNRNAAYLSAFACAVITIIITVFTYKNGQILIFNSLLKLNLYTHLTQILILILGAIILLMLFFSKYDYSYEFPVIILFSLFSMMAIIGANDLISFYLAFELQSITLYVLACFERKSIYSSEAGVKYFTLGALSSCIMLYGMSLIYGYTGKTNFTDLAVFFSNYETLGAVLGVMLILLSICFKISIAPFHLWAPDVYQGSPTIVTAFFAIAPKATFVTLLIRLLSEEFTGIMQYSQNILIFASTLSVAISAFGATQQQNLKRLFAYSAIGHAGYMLIAIALGTQEGVTSAFIYLIIYLITNIGLFSYLVQIDDDNCNIECLAGLGKKNPIIAFNLSILMLSMAGIPPIAGFFSKFYVLSSLIKFGFINLSIVLIILSVVACYYYLRVIKVIYFDEGKHKKSEGSRELLILSTISVIINISFFAYAEKFKKIIDLLVDQVIY
ncbi:MAG: NADH-quinone oxidoreductase subunit N [Candidatus Mesenet longicola]|uniref:NADH-quinone oxidoreductase subunit N n=1 Tax=Candidatus Mesenet longicola TaxID=1892558 RepID=A0A8J3MQS1_9RICK|nr:MAG: NADH-quinone oxidoreductase subunit N [Candidatus Mesenet longicola]GHM59847.1 MAG: NADH-quinone oxidoreductase subunit N [Candidatus Mesenet longicola]